MKQNKAHFTDVQKIPLLAHLANHDTDDPQVVNWNHTGDIF